MKKIIKVLLVLGIVMSLVGCQKEDQTAAVTEFTKQMMEEIKKANLEVIGQEKLTKETIQSYFKIFDESENQELSNMISEMIIDSYSKISYEINSIEFNDDQTKAYVEMKIIYPDFAKMYQDTYQEFMNEIMLYYMDENNTEELSEAELTDRYITALKAQDDTSKTVATIKVEYEDDQWVFDDYDEEFSLAAELNLSGVAEQVFGQE